MGDIWQQQIRHAWTNDPMILAPDSKAKITHHKRECFFRTVRLVRIRSMKARDRRIVISWHSMQWVA
ncbi:hypothetical protein W02_33040 [Nitrospira sp. KM1]|uniref:hypothetical protein n=1 Tax=Nitrospira sp. KM1 TaxID=1936990 RepID=UPI0013A79CCB|nr:hypothetical protein [Nitrospira sp. KM1]BCA56164.1 hypothetical protein W02_33040 [Nitrospira sp. KM1]